MENIRYFHQANVSESLGNGWQTMKNFFLYLLVVVFIQLIVEGGFGGSNTFRYSFDNIDDLQSMPFSIPGLIFGSLFLFLVVLFVTPVIKYGASYMFLEASRNNKPSFNSLVSGFSKNYLSIIISNIVVGILTIIGFIFIIIPGIIIACRLFMVPYLVMDKNLNAIEAIEESWRLTRFRGWTVFGLAITSFFIIIAGFMLLIIGMFPAIIWVNASFASLYQAIITEKEEIPISE